MSALLRGRTWYPTNTTPLPYRRAKSGMPRARRGVDQANARRRHAAPTTRLALAWHHVATAYVVALRTVIATASVLIIGGPVAYGVGL